MAAVNVNRWVNVTATFSEVMDPATISASSFELRDSLNNPVPASVTYNGATKTAVLNPTGPLAGSTTYTATVKGGTSGVKDLAGNPIAADYAWSFATRAETLFTIWNDETIPSDSYYEGEPYEFGVKFRADVDGYIIGVRFYKVVGDTGTHVGKLYNLSGTPLASVNFTNETASGWQEMWFGTPVLITANTTYMATYSSSLGYYAADPGYFATETYNAPLHALPDGVDGPNGMFKEGNGFPDSSFGSANYWVDVAFSTTGSIQSFTVSGTVTPALANVVMSGLPGSPVTNSSGVYTKTVPYNWSGTVTPIRTGYNFTPASRTYTNVQANQTAQNYTQALQTFTISGTVTLGGNPLANVVMSGLPGSPVTNASGVYTGTVTYNWTGTVTPTLAGYDFTPATRSYTNVQANQAAQDYTAAVQTFTISGTVTSGGNPLANVVMSGLPGNPVTNASGVYTGTVTYNWTGTVTPTLAGYVFTPATRSYTNVRANQASQNYTAVQTFTLTYTAGANGSITGVSPQTVNYGASGTAVTAVPATGYHFVQWSDASTANPRTDTNVTANITVTASFAINTYTLTYNAGANGSITGVSPQTVNHGASGTAVTAVPATGYHFVQWSDASTTNPRTDSNVTANITVTAIFAINTYTLTYNAGANGSITGVSPQTVNHGASGTAVTAVPATGYHFVQWSDASTANPRTDSNVTANITVTASLRLTLTR